MLSENPLWRTERIRGEVLKLGIVVSNRSIRRHRWQRPNPVGSQKWRSFLANELKGTWDLLVVRTVRYRTLYVFFFIAQARRELVHFNVAASPTAAWIWQQVINATPWRRQPGYLVHDWGRGLRQRLWSQARAPRDRERPDADPCAASELDR